MSLLLHVIGNVIFFCVLAAVVLTLMTWLSKKPKSDKITPPSLGELPEDKATHVNRISRSYSSSRQELKEEQERRRA